MPGNRQFFCSACTPNFGFMIASRMGFCFRTVCRFSLQRLAPYTPRSYTHPAFSSFNSDDQRSGSEVYRRKLQFQRPTTIKWQPQLENSVNFIGSVVRPVEIYKNRTNPLGVYTFLHVKNSHSNRGFDILLEMWKNMAELCRKHLKANDFVYVSGRLQSYTKLDRNGNLWLRYKVIVKDLNYVTKHGQGLAFRKSEEGEAGMEKYENRLYLWHLYFTNPYEWWDNRKNKLYPSSPDFKHKDTDEALWLDPNDPPWIKKQLQLIDSKRAEPGLGNLLGSRSCVSTWVYDDYEPGTSM